MLSLDGNKGLVIVITGDGKGKTTAAFGQALRAVGHGLRVEVIQFLKKVDSGEVRAASRLEGLTVKQFGTGDFGDLEHPEPREFEMARLGLEAAWKAVEDPQNDMVILDEINTALHYRLVPLNDILSLINNRPPGLHLILTGRNAPAEIIELADTVSEIIEIKHHHSRGYPARRGIEH
ncbi:MAG: cob(I)yrinic acid a,c-diamide adenosyltransferase [Syntrophomonadaceae bacterium]|nr:cob(I)yrinic acid a,c-diamide adenosyltransferase [Syntrophomonadaceae bacterium]